MSIYSNELLWTASISTRSEARFLYMLRLVSSLQARITLLTNNKGSGSAVEMGALAGGLPLGSGSCMVSCYSFLSVIGSVATSTWDLNVLTNSVPTVCDPISNMPASTIDGNSS